MTPRIASAIIAAHHALLEEIRSAPATPAELEAFESEHGPIPLAYRWYLEHCGGGVVGAEWVDDIHQLRETQRKFNAESALEPRRGGWTMRDVFVFGWDGAGNPMAIRASTGEVVVEDHNFGGVHVLAPSFERFLTTAFEISVPE